MKRKMRIYIIVINIILCFVLNSWSQAQGISTSNTTQLSELKGTNTTDSFKTNGTNAKDIIPENWEIISEATGDLNGDGINDLAFFSSKNVKREESEDYSKKSKIVLAIYWGKDESFTQYKIYDDITSPEDDQITYEELSINITGKRILSINVSISLGFGSWTNPDFSKKYRYQNGAFYKIGYDSDQFNRGSGDAHRISINYLTGKKIITTYNAFDETIPQKTEKESFNEPLKELGSETIF